MRSVLRRRTLPPFSLLALILSLLPRPGAAQSSLPQPWQLANIGNPVPAGTAAFGADVFTLSSGGTDIAGTYDRFAFVYQAVSGDTKIIARIDALSGDRDAKVGVMIRGALTPDAAHAFTYLSPGRGTGFLRRKQTGASSTAATGIRKADAPVWVSLERGGAQITARTSVDGVSWTLLSTDTIAFGATAYIGLAITGHSATTAAQSRLSRVALTSGLPAPQQHRDIGAPALAGSVSFNQGRYTISAAGDDIWWAADQFHYVYQQVTGDLDVVARIESLVRTDDWAKAGVMIRESLTAESVNVMALVSAATGYSFQWRNAPSAASDYIWGGSGGAPAWVKLVRRGTTVSGYQSSDGRNWILIGSVTVAMPASVYVGVAVTSHATNLLTTAVVDNFSVTNTVTPPPSNPSPTSPVNKVPTVTITAPINPAVATAPATLAIAADANDPENRLSRVDFAVNGTVVFTDTAPPFSTMLSSLAAGSYSLTAVAYDADGGRGTSSPVTLTVNAQQQWILLFAASGDDSSNVSGYRAEIFAAGADPNMSAPAVTQDLGKPPLDLTNHIAVDLTVTVRLLAPGNYFATVVAVGPGGQTRSQPWSFSR